MRSSTFQSPHPQNRCRAKDSAPKTSLIAMITTLFLALVMQVGSLQAQAPAQNCPNCVSEDIKAVGLSFVVKDGVTCLDADKTFSGELKLNIDVTSNTRYGFWIVYDLYSTPAGGTSTKVGTYYKCFPEDFIQGPHTLSLQTIPDLPAGTTLQIKNVLTAWDNNDPNGGQGGKKYFCDRPVSEMTCTLVTPKCKYYGELGSVTVTAKPTVSVAASSPIVCSGSSAYFTITGDPSNPPAYTVTVQYSLNGGNWVSVPNFTGTLQVPVSNVTLAQTLVAKISKIIPNAPVCDGNTTTPVVISVQQPSSASVAPISAICASTNTISVSATSTPVTGSWSSSSTNNPDPAKRGSFVNASSPSTTYNVGVADKLAGTVTLTWTTTAQSACPAASASRTVSITPIPTVIAGLPIARCQQSGTQTVTLAGSSFGGSATCAAWSVVDGPAGLSSTACTASPETVTYTIPADYSGTITLRLTTDAGSPCTGVSLDRIITVTEKPSATASATPSTICENQTTTLGVNSSVTNGSWSFVGGVTLGTFAPNNTTKAAVFTPNQVAKDNAVATGSTTITLRWTTADPDGDGPCVATSSDVVVTLRALPTVNAGNDQTTCSGSEVTVTAATARDAGATVVWTAIPNVGTIVSPNSKTTKYNAPANYVGAITLRATVYPGAGSPCTSTSYDDVVINYAQCAAFCTYTQGYFGQDLGNGRATYPTPYDNPTGCTTTQAYGTIKYALSSWGAGGMKVSKNLTFKASEGNIQLIRDYLPGGGPSASFLGDTTALKAIAGQTPKNTLLTQTITLGLNLGLNKNLANYSLQTGTLKTAKSVTCGTATTTEYDCFDFDISSLTKNSTLTVKQLYDLAVLALSNETSISKSAIASQVGKVNEAFDECRVAQGWGVCEDREKLNPESLMLTESFTKANTGAAKNLTVKAFPNPFKDRVTIQFTSPVSGKAVVEIFDMTGRRLEMINKGQVVAGRVNTVDYMVPVTNRNSIIYKVTVDNFSVNGRLVSPGK